MTEYDDDSLEDDELPSDFSGEETVQVGAEVPKSLKEVAFRKLDHGEFSTKIRELLNSIAFGGDITERAILENEVDHERQEIRNLRSQKREIEKEIQDREDRVQSLQRELDRKDSREDKFEGALESLEFDLRRGTHIDPKHPKVEHIAALAGLEPAGVLKKLRERNPDVPPDAFEPKMLANEWNGLGAEDASRSLQERQENVHPDREGIVQDE